MSDQSRALPDRPSLRFLKLEAKRRLAAGEFTSLDQTQLAIAREHGMSSWTVLKQHIEAGSHALAQLRWVIARFSSSDSPQWTEPDEHELRQHFDDRYLGLVPLDWITRLFRTVAKQLREGLADVEAEPLRLRARLADLRVEAATETEPPYRLRQLRLYPLERKVVDPRVSAPPRRDVGLVPEKAAEVAKESVAELGLVGLLVAGANGDGSVWVTTRGWANLDQHEVLQPSQRFPAYSITKLVTTTVVLRLVADGRVGLDEPANAYLRTIRLADNAVTVRELLSHSGGVDNPMSMFAERVPDLVSVTGPVAACGGTRGEFAYGHGEYALLGQLIADVTGSPYEDVATRVVLEPLGLRGSWFPREVPDVAAGYRLTDEGVFERDPARVSVVPSAGGMWTTATDLVHLGLGWSSLLPDTLAREALTPQAEGAGVGGHAGLGWGLVPAKDIAGCPGAGPGFSASLIIRPSTGQPWVVFTNRRVLVEAVNERLALPLP